MQKQPCMCPSSIYLVIDGLIFWASGQHPNHLYIGMCVCVVCIGRLVLQLSFFRADELVMAIRAISGMVEIE